MSEQSEADRSRLNRFWTLLRALGYPHGLALVLWPIVTLVIAILAIRSVSSAKELADLISAFAALMWPLAVLAIVGWFRPEIRTFVSRIRKGKLFGQEFELDELQASTEAAEATESTVVAVTGLAEGTSSATAEVAREEAAENIEATAAQDEIEEVLREASRSPRIGLILLSSKIEQSARAMAAEIGLGASRRPVPLTSLFRQLAQAEQLTPEDVKALNLFIHVRNQIVHGHDANDDEITRAIDSGTRLLRLLLSRQRSAQGRTDAADGG
jgi:hypothetical protein